MPIPAPGETYRVPGMMIFDPDQDTNIQSLQLRFFFGVEMVALLGTAYPDPLQAKRAHDDRMEMFRQKIDASMSRYISELSKALESIFERRHEDFLARGGTGPDADRRRLLSQGRVDFFRSGQFLARFSNMPPIKLIDDCYEKVTFEAANKCEISLSPISGKATYDKHYFAIGTSRLMQGLSLGYLDDEIVDKFARNVWFHELLHYGVRLSAQQVSNGLFVVTKGMASYTRSFTSLLDNDNFGGMWAEEGLVDWLTLQIALEAGSPYPNNVGIMRLLDHIAPTLIEGAFDVSYRGIHADIATTVYPPAQIVHALRTLLGQPNVFPLVQTDIHNREDVLLLRNSDPLFRQTVVPNTFWNDLVQHCQTDPVFAKMFEDLSVENTQLYDAVVWDLHPDVEAFRQFGRPSQRRELAHLALSYKETGIFSDSVGMAL